MSAPDREQAELLDRYWQSLVEGSGALPPARLEPGLAATARHLSGLRPPEPAAALIGRLRRELQAQATPAPCRRRVWMWPALARRAPAWLAAAALAIVIGSVAFRALCPQPVSAQDVIRRAQAVGRSTATARIRSLAVTQSWRSWPGNQSSLGGDLRGDEELWGTARGWYEAPNRWRFESDVTLDTQRPDPGRVALGVTSVSNGVDVWDYDQYEHEVRVSRWEPNSEGPPVYVGGPYGLNLAMMPGDGDLGDLLARASEAFTPCLRPSQTVAGRPAYVVELLPKERPAPPVTAEDDWTGGRRLLWIDQRTFLVLKVEMYGAAADRLYCRWEVTSIQYDEPIDAALFAYTPPPGAKLIDRRGGLPSPREMALTVTPAPPPGMALTETPAPTPGL